MHSRLQDQLQWRADMLFARRYDDLAREYLYPLAIYIEDKQIIAKEPSEMVAFARSMRAVLDARHVNRLRVEVTALELPRNGRFRVWSVWDEESPEAKVQSETIHYMRETEQGLRTEMLEYVRLGSHAYIGCAPSQRQRA